MNKDVEDYERVVKEKVALGEQISLRHLEAEKLNYKANSIKGK